jgi:hypothetical protein
VLEFTAIIESHNMTLNLNAGPEADMPSPFPIATSPEEPKEFFNIYRPGIYISCSMPA